MPTAVVCASFVTISANDAAGVSAPRSATVKPRPSQRVGEERGREAVPVAGGRTEHDETACRAAPGEERPEPADEPGGERAGTMFFGDADAAGFPLVADGTHRRCERVEVELLRGEGRREGVLGEAPGFGLVAFHEEDGELGGVVAPAGGGRRASCVRARSPRATR